MDYEKLLQELVVLTDRVGEAIMPSYLQQSEQQALKLKEDGSPLTAADLKANQVIAAGLAELTPDVPILSEESCDIPYAERRHWQRYWLIDPIDGTKEFLAANGEFTINIALIENHKVVMGVVAAPALNLTYFAMKGFGAFKRDFENKIQRIHVRSCAQNEVHVIASRRHGHEYFTALREKFNTIELLHCGSSLKFCLVAEGKADLYPRLGLTSEWDTAAAQCILEEAGGAIYDFNRFTLQYNTHDSYLNPYFIAVGDTQVDWFRYFPHDKFNTN